MNKKKIGALLVGATLLVGAMGSFAYFTSNAKLQGNMDNNGALQAIQITNGRVIVKADITGEGENLSDWTYDVARLSTDKDGTTQESILAFEDRHRSPDITLASDGTENPERSPVEGSTIMRANIGAKLPNNIQNTRPGDAIVLGYKNKDGETGLKIDVDTNLTVKMRVIATDMDKDPTNGVNNDYLDSLEEAGWKLYVNNEEKTFEELKGGLPLSSTNQLLQIRFELPIDAENAYQNKQTLADSNGNGFDLSKLIEIQATQENNTDWEQIYQNNYDKPTPPIDEIVE